MRTEVHLKVDKLPRAAWPAEWKKGHLAGWTAHIPPLEIMLDAPGSRSDLLEKALSVVKKDRPKADPSPPVWEKGPPFRLRTTFHHLLRVLQELEFLGPHGVQLARCIQEALPEVPAPQAIKTAKGELRFGGLPLLMGVINVTPDSFSDGGLYLDPGAATDRAWQLIEEGADIIDIGGESTRPGAYPVPAEEELRRIRPVLRRLAPSCPIPISVDTYKAQVAEAALGDGADIINDISGFAFEPVLASVVARHGAPVIVAHTRGRPRTMQKNPWYRWLVADVIERLAESLKRAQKEGLPLELCLIDPGLGFGKTFQHNEELIDALAWFRHLGRPVVLGPSRKAFIRAAWGSEPEALLRGTIEVCRKAARLGASVLRVHDVAPVRKAIYREEG
jgi:dihydropteroate synthase